MIVGRIPPSGGRILVDGTDVTYADPRERDMAMVFQNYALYPSKTVRGNLEFPLRMRGIPSASRTAAGQRDGRATRPVRIARQLSRASFPADSSSASHSGARSSAARSCS